MGIEKMKTQLLQIECEKQKLRKALGEKRILLQKSYGRTTGKDKQLFIFRGGSGPP